MEPSAPNEHWLGKSTSNESHESHEQQRMGKWSHEQQRMGKWSHEQQWLEQHASPK
jgi:hypothetical protein